MVLLASLGGAKATMAKAVYPSPATVQHSVGVLLLKPPVTFYAQPQAHAPIVEQWQWQNGTPSSHYSPQQLPWLSTLHDPAPTAPHTLWLDFDPQQQLALLLAEQESPDGQWIATTLPSTGQTAWVILANEALAHWMPWPDFARYSFKPFGIGGIDGVPTALRTVRTKPEDTAAPTAISYWQGLKVLHARGNWLLVEVKDLGDERPMGWVRWRDETGNLLLWPRFDRFFPPLAPAGPPKAPKFIDPQGLN
jgi:hypothetical protein